MKRVCQVPAEGLSSDMWSWRKYGQKPIKGSPYPRGYYKCSTQKGCLARKQVERNRSNPGMFIVTYTGDHTHPAPTHRNSLAGATRHITPKPITGGDPIKAPSPPSPDKMDAYDESDEFSPSDAAIGDDFFEGLEDLAGDIFSDHFQAADLELREGLTFGCE